MKKIISALTVLMFGLCALITMPANAATPKATKTLCLKSAQTLNCTDAAPPLLVTTTMENSAEVANMKCGPVNALATIPIANATGWDNDAGCTALNNDIGNTAKKTDYTGFNNSSGGNTDVNLSGQKVSGNLDLICGPMEFGNIIAQLNITGAKMKAENPVIAMNKGGTKECQSGCECSACATNNTISGNTGFNIRI